SIAASHSARSLAVILSESIPNLSKSFDLFRRDAGPEAQEHLEGGMPGAVEKLKTEGLLAIEMAWLLHGEDRTDLSPADVHVQRLGLDVEEIARRAEVAELPVCLQGGCPVGDDDMHLAKRFQRADQLFPALGIQLNGALIGKGPNNLDLR